MNVGTPLSPSQQNSAGTAGRPNWKKPSRQQCPHWQLHLYLHRHQWHQYVHPRFPLLPLNPSKPRRYLRRQSCGCSVVRAAAPLVLMRSSVGSAVHPQENTPSRHHPHQKYLLPLESVYVHPAVHLLPKRENFVVYAERALTVLTHPRLYFPLSVSIHLPLNNPRTPPGPGCAGHAETQSNPVISFVVNVLLKWWMIQRVLQNRFRHLLH
jgi:hypothetical protein